MPKTFHYSLVCVYMNCLMHIYNGSKFRFYYEVKMLYFTQINAVRVGQWLVDNVVRKVFPIKMYKYTCNNIDDLKEKAL